MFKKIMLIIILSLLFLVIASYALGWAVDWSFGKKPIWGATFSPIYAKYLGLDWKEAYQVILNDLGIKKLRLIAYWSIVEQKNDAFNFNDLDWQVQKAKEANKKVILTVGLKCPRWPECHQPDWVKNLSNPVQKQETLEFIEQTIKHYKDNEAIEAWQLENEPLIDFFGECPPPNPEFLNQEIKLVKSLDSSRPIVITDSGEMSTFRKTAGLSEILGTTLYRTVWHKWLGVIQHWQYNPMFYKIRADLVKKFTKTKKVIIAELQAEPWGTKNRSLIQMPIEEQLNNFKLKDLEGNLWYAKRTGLPEIYLWGVEWAYWLKAKQGNPDYWNLMKEYIK